MHLSVKNIKKTFKGSVHAVRDVSFDLGPGESLGLVGESGSGKSTLARIVMQLIEPSSGEIFWEGRELTPRRAQDFRRRAQIIFQNPFSSFDPRLTVGASLAEAYRLAGVTNAAKIDAVTRESLASVNLSSELMRRFPHELSGGECQRAAIARALSRDPQLLVCDEPVSSLDLLAQARILNLLLKLQQERGISLLFISHDLRVVRHLCERLIVLKDGAVCEEGPLSQVFAKPQHPYTQELLVSSGI